MFNGIKMLVVGIILTTSICSCTIITREQANILRNHGFLLELRADTNERAKQHLESDLEVNSPVIRIIDQNSELHKQSAKLIFTIVGE